MEFRGPSDLLSAERIARLELTVYCADNKSGIIDIRRSGYLKDLAPTPEQIEQLRRLGYEPLS